MAPKDKLWPLELHTSAKHDILRSYLGAWFPKMGSGQWAKPRIVFMDGFAGPGEYVGGEPGSPLIALTTLLEHRAFATFRSEFVFIFMEERHDRFTHLADRLTEMEHAIGGWPPNVKVHVLESPFEAAAEEIMGGLNHRGKSIAPTFAFIDPFGFSGVPLDLIKRLLAGNGCEVFFNFMSEKINRFVEHPDEKIHDHFEDLFGCLDYRNAASLPTGQRLEYLCDLYGKQLRTEGGFDHVWNFEMVSQRGRGGHIGYHLFHGTRHREGVRAMKDAMWRVDPSGRYCFSSRLANQQVLLRSHDVDTTPLQHALLDHFAASDASVEEIETFTLLETPFKDSHWNKLTLKPMEATGLISIAPQSPPRRVGTFPTGTIIRFP